MAWNDRLKLLGDPDFTEVPITKLLSSDYAQASAAKVLEAVKEGKPLDFSLVDKPQTGTIHLSAADRQGNMASLTLTHGGSFGAQITVPEIGITLGHGLSRFDVDPNHPNCPGPGKRPLNNMCPAILTKENRAVMAVGGRGGRKIPNAMISYLSEYLLTDDCTLARALARPRFHTEGSLNMELEPGWTSEDATRLEEFGYKIRRSANATLSAVALESSKIVSGIR